MPTESASQALEILRDGSQFEWYVVPLLAFVLYVYAVEVEKKNWNVVFAGLALWGVDWFNEIWNGLVFHFTQYAPVWGAPGDTAFLLLIGLNIEICFMFAVAGVVFAKFLPADRDLKVLGMPNRWFVAIVGSAGNYPYGLIDPLEKLSAIALKHDIGMHVDGCLGGFIFPWIEKLGYDIPPFDFRLPGVTSMSADTHKYGFALKGTSVVLYRRNSFRRHQYFNVPDWPGGMYASPTAAGSRSGGLTAATWASLVYLGEEGYLKAAKSIMAVADQIKSGIEAIPELALIGTPTFVISFRSDEVDVFHINDFMKTRGWRFNVLQLPSALHFCVTMPQTFAERVAERFLEDLHAGVDYARSRAGTVAETTALYGLAGTIEGNQQVTEMVFGFFDYLYSV